MPIDEHDHVIVGVNPALAVLAKAAWPSSRLAVRGGPDGADIALLETVKARELRASRYDQAVIGSGDGVFEVAVSASRNCGVPVGVVARASNHDHEEAVLHLPHRYVGIGVPKERPRLGGPCE